MNKRGFTIIEVVLFLGLSGLLLLVAFIGTGSMATRQRLTDTTDSFEAFLQSQYNEVVNGVNTREKSYACGGSAQTIPGSETANGCLLLGRLIAVPANSQKVITSYLVSNKALSLETEATGTDQEKLSEATIAIASRGWSEYELKWGAQIAKAFRPAQPNKVAGPVNRIAFLKMPDSGKVVQIYYNDNTEPSYIPNGDGTYRGPSSGRIREIITDSNNYDTADNINYKPGLKICLMNNRDFVGSGVRSAVVFGGSAQSMNTDYQAEGC